MPATTALLLCVIVSISDGDTVTARCNASDGPSTRTIKVRLAEIDAPEHHQPFGARSKEHLATLCFQRLAEIHPIATNHGLDRYGRTVAHVTCDGVDANTEQVRTGMAWVFDRFVKDRSLYRLQAEAMAAQRGLWVDPEPIPPWKWRAATR
jgi:endonuclease YncB( thermonuclease family)